MGASPPNPYQREFSLWKPTLINNKMPAFAGILLFDTYAALTFVQASEKTETKSPRS
jgi:hypothetical protein